MITSKSIRILECRKISIKIQVPIRFWPFSFIGHAKDKEVYFLQQGWASLVEMTETEGDK